MVTHTQMSLITACFGHTLPLKASVMQEGMYRQPGFLDHHNMCQLWQHVFSQPAKRIHFNTKFKKLAMKEHRRPEA